MNKPHRFAGIALAGAGLAAGLLLSGCGTPGAPQPPSLNLPGRVTGLAANRTGNEISLTWTMPKKNTDKLLLKGNIPVRVCRKEGTGGQPAVCDTTTATLFLTPGAEGAFTETLRPPLATGAARPLAYFVELTNRNGRSAGLSNAAVVVAGDAPAALDGVVAQVRKGGIVLRWTPVSGDDSIRLHRKLLAATPETKPKAQAGPFAPQPEAVEQNLLVEAGAGAGRVLDKDIHFGQTYEYRAQRVARLTVDGKKLELAGPLSAPVRVEALDVFPPAVPTGLAAVANDGAELSIDLSWQPGTDADLAGYAVYRRENGGTWQRISPAQPLVPPAYRDGQVQAGHTYSYAVSAIDQGGHESARSAEAEETVPNP
jgi:hypothetical protein